MFSSIFPPILSTNLSQFEQLKKKTNFLLVQNMFFFLSLPVEKEIIINIRRFGIRNWWKLSDESINFPPSQNFILFCKSLKITKVTPLKMLCHLYFLIPSDQCVRKILHRQFEPFFDRFDTRYISYINITTNVCVQCTLNRTSHSSITFLLLIWAPHFFCSYSKMLIIRLEIPRCT